MNEAEQILAALMYNVAAEAGDHHFRGPISTLRQLTEESYGLERFADAFDNALRFWQEREVAYIHSYVGVEPYVSLDGKHTVTESVFHMQKGNGPFASGEPPEHPILVSYFDVGSSWLHDVAIAFRDRDQAASPERKTYDSSSWTGRYQPTSGQIKEIRDLMVRVRAEVENANLTNAQRSNALALLNSTETLMDAPDPEWSLILSILSSPILANITSLAALVVALIKS